METEKVDQPTGQAVETQAPKTEPKTEPVTTEKTLSDVVKKFNVDKISTEFTAKPQPEKTVQPAAPSYTPPVPDPITQPDDFAKYQIQQSQYVGNTLRELGQQVQEISRKAQQAELDAEVNQAVKRVNEKVNADPDLMEAYLQTRYGKDPVFKMIWDNRKFNPAALNEALDVISNEAASKFQVKVDPQLQENIRAAKASTQTKTGPTSRPSDEEAALQMSDGEFDRWWNQRKRG